MLNAHYWLLNVDSNPSIAYNDVDNVYINIYIDIL